MSRAGRLGLGDQLRFVGAALRVTSAGRLRRGPLRPSWSARRELVHQLLVLLQTHGGRLGCEQGYPAERAFFDRLAASRGLPLRLRRRLRFEDVDAGGVPALLACPARGAGRGLLYLHGGAYLFGSPQSYRELVGRLALAADAEVLAPAYRLRPEHPFVASLDDARAAWGWLCARRPGERLVVAGDSAGGNLALRLCLSGRGAGGTVPAAAALLCPWVDLGASGGSWEENQPFDILPRAFLDRWTADVLAGADPRDPAFSPVHADLRGLPPLLVQSGAAEILRDQVRVLVERARAAGVQVEAREWPDEPHDWQLLASFVPTARAAIAEVAEFVRRHAGR